jgi:hypothetical protein
MRTIEEIRLENYRALVNQLQAELGGAIGDGDVSAYLGISKVYAWQLRSGKRGKIDSPAARKMEKAVGKAVGWLDTDFKLWPFPGIAPDRYEHLSHDERMEIQGQVRGWMEKFEASKQTKFSKTGTGN